jgi:tRNA G10  N-methylase Trm11
MIYFFVLGNNPTLSLAELNAVLPCQNGSLANKDLFVWETDSLIVPERLIKTLGGTIKIGVFDQVLAAGSRTILESLTEISLNLYKKRESKFNFGLSDYGNIPFNLPVIGLELKKQFKEQGLNCRFVTSRDKNLSSVVVGQNNLLSERGAELVLARLKDKVFVGHTAAIQPFKDLSKRDFGRPARDDQSGMLPPKLASIMINLAEINDDQALILDPFCGSGTILQEALLMGYTNVAGTDLSPKAVADTKQNLDWLKKSADISQAKINVFLKNAVKLTESFKENSVAAIITEPYLGPQRGWNDLKIIKTELEALYTQMLRESAKILKPHGRVVMVWPLFFGNKPVNPDYYQFQIIAPLATDWQANPLIKLTNRKTIVYGRAGQKVFREIVILEKK